MMLVPNLVCGYGGCYGLLYGHPRPQSSPYKRLTCSYFFTPLRKIAGFAIKSYVCASCSVKSLLGFIRPLTVFRAVISVVVDALNRVALTRLIAHVGIEVLKRISPSITYRNSPPPIPEVEVVVGVAASSNHPLPCHIFGGAGSTVRSISGGKYFADEAPAGFCAPRAKTVGRNHSRVSARAAALPHNKPMTPYVSSDNCGEFPKTLTGKVNSLRHFVVLGVVAMRNYTTSGLNGSGAQLQTDPAGSITAEQCEAIANNAVVDAATLTFLQDWAKRQHEVKP